MTTSMLIARLNDRAQPLHRGELYEDPLNEVLMNKNLGEVTGGGTQLGEKNEIVFCDIELQIEGSIDAAVPIITAELEVLGAPKGSKLLLENGAREISFGKNEGMAVYLNGTDLTKEVYEQSDVNIVIEEFGRLLGDEGNLHSYWEGPEETGLYLYGPSFEKMKARLSKFMSTYPLCWKARVVQIA